MFRNFSSNIISSLKPVSLDIDAGSPIDVAAVVVTGLVVVFLALIILIVFVWLYGKIFDYIRNSKKKKAAKPAPAPVETVKQTDIKPTEEPEQEVFSSTEDEIVAAISAVIAQISSEEGVKYRVKSITPVSSGNASRRSAWAFEGRCQNTNPF